MCLRWPWFIMRATLNLEPSSTKIKNCHFSLLLGWYQCPTSADTVANFGGCGSKVARFLGLGELCSWQTSHLNFRASSNTCSGKFPCWMVRTKYFRGPWPVAAWSKYSFFRTLSLSRIHFLSSHDIMNIVILHATLRTVTTRHLSLMNMAFMTNAV